MNTTGAKLTKGQEASPAWKRADEVIAMYKAGIGFTIIARKLAISKRITREILIKRGHWKPNPLRNGVARKGIGMDSSRNPQRLANAMRRVDATCKSRLNALHEAIQRVVARCQRPVKQTDGMSEAQRFKWKYDNEPSFRVAHLMRERMRKIIKGGHISARQLSLLGCTRAEFVAHIQKQFKRGMNWNNMGVGVGKWNLDHITPCAAFDQRIASQRATCWHFTNFQPMWSIANIIKSDTVDHRNAQLGLAL